MFHLLLQNAEREWRQDPTFYVFAFLDPISRAPRYRTRRVSFGWLPPREVVFIYERISPTQDRFDAWFTEFIEDNGQIPQALMDQADAMARQQAAGAPYFYMLAGIIDEKGVGQAHQPLIDVYDGCNQAVGFGNRINDRVAEFLEDHLYGRLKEMAKKEGRDPKKPYSLYTSMPRRRRNKRRIF